jgi:hypothetical protein
MSSCRGDRWWYLMNKTMEQTKGKTSSTRIDARTFSKAEFLASGKEAVDYAATTGTAVVVDADGKPVTVISILTKDLPVLDG